MIAVGVVGIIIVFIMKGFDDHSEYTIPAAEVMKIESERARKEQEAKEFADENAKDMGLIEFIRTAPGWLLSEMRNK